MRVSMSIIHVAGISMWGILVVLVYVRRVPMGIILVGYIHV